MDMEQFKGGIGRFVAFKKKLMIDGDLDLIMAFYDIPSREIAEITMHRVRAGEPDLPEDVREASKKWLEERGHDY